MFGVNPSRPVLRERLFKRKEKPMQENIQQQVDALFKENNWQGIIDLLKPIVDAGDHSIDYLRNLGFAYSQLDQYKNARRYYQIWLQFDPKRPQPYYSIGYTYYDGQNWEKAIKWFDKALSRFPSYVVCLYRKGVALFMWGKETKAKSVLESAISSYKFMRNTDMQKRLAKYYYRSVFYLGKCELALGNFGSARACFEKNLEDAREYIDPIYVKYNLAYTLVKNRKYDEAEKYLEEITTKYANKEWIFRLWGNLLQARGEYRLAIEKYTQALKIRIQPYILINRAEAHIKNDDLEYAKQDLYEALKRDRKAKHKILLRLAGIAMAQEQLTKAEQLAKRAIEFKLKVYEADFANAHYFLYKLYEKMGEDEKSFQELEMAQKLFKEWEWENRRPEFDPETMDEEPRTDELFRL